MQPLGYLSTASSLAADDWFKPLREMWSARNEMSGDATQQGLPYEVAFGELISRSADTRAGSGMRVSNQDDRLPTRPGK